VKRLAPLWITAGAWTAWAAYLFSPFPTAAVDPVLTYIAIAILSAASVAVLPRTLMRDAVTNVFIKALIFFALYMANFSFFLMAAIVVRGK